MTQEEVNSIAKEYAEDKYCRTDGNLMPKYKIAQIHAGRDGFVAGAEWRINSVWHDISETPDFDKEILIMGDDGDCLILCWTKLRDRACKSYFTKWAYMKDLLPSKED